jgi:hypothetical protein
VPIHTDSYEGGVAFYRFPDLGVGTTLKKQEHHVDLPFLSCTVEGGDTVTILHVHISPAIQQRLHQGHLATCTGPE